MHSKKPKKQGSFKQVWNKQQLSNKWAWKFQNIKQQRELQMKNSVAYKKKSVYTPFS